MTRIWLVNWHFQSRITLWCRYKSTNVSILCWQMLKFIVWRLWSIYFDHHLPLKPSIGKRRKQSCTPNIFFLFISLTQIFFNNVLACLFIMEMELSIIFMASSLTSLLDIADNINFLPPGKLQTCNDTAQDRKRHLSSKQRLSKLLYRDSSCQLPRDPRIAWAHGNDVTSHDLARNLNFARVVFSQFFSFLAQIPSCLRQLSLFEF